jgi:peptidyl-prolyl cis-trans isomerase C
MMKKITSVFALVLAMVFFVSFASVRGVFAEVKKRDASKIKQMDKDILARIGNKTITKADFEARISVLPPQYQQALKDEKAKKDFFEMVIQAHLFALAAKDEKLDKDAKVAMQIEDMTNGILAQEFVRRKLSKIEKITDEQIKQYYDENKDKLINPPTVRVQHILIKLAEGAKPEETAAALAKAEKLRKDLEGGADFGKLAEQYSDDPETKVNGGDLGYFTQQQMVPEFSEPVFKMKPGEISQPIKSPFGFHIVKVNDKTEGKPMDLKEATPTIQSAILNIKQKKVLENEVNRLKKKYKVTVLYDKK